MQSNGTTIKLNKNQVEFFRALAKYDCVVDSGTWRSGKSFELTLYAAERMKKYPGIREFMGRKTLKSLRETTFLKFQEVLTEHKGLYAGIDYKVVKSPSPMIKFPNGSICIFGDLDDVNKWLSAEYSDILIDQAEEIRKLAFEKIKSRQTQTIIEKQSKGKQKNKILLAMNPPEIAEQHWAHNTFRNPETKIKNSIMLYSHIENNKDNIPVDYIEDMQNSVDKRTAEIYLAGHWVPMLSKIVYADYKFPRDKSGYLEGGNLRHLKVKLEYENYIAMDFGWVHPMSIGCWQYNPRTDNYYRLYEVVESYVKPETYCDLLQGKRCHINNKYYQLPITAHNSLLLPLVEAKQRRQEAEGKSNLSLMKQIFQDRGISINYHISNVGILKGILAVRNHILTKNGERKLFVDPRYNKRFISDCQGYHYPVDRDGNVNSEIPEKDNITDHTQDETRGMIGWKSPIRQQEIWRH